MGERNNPQTRIAWEQAKQAAEAVGIAKADLFPTLAFDTLALNGNLLFGLPSNISSQGVIKVDSTIVQPSISLAWTVFDFGGNLATYDHAKYLALASKMALNQTNQKVALQIYSRLLQAADCEGAVSRGEGCRPGEPRRRRFGKGALCEWTGIDRRSCPGESPAAS